MLLHDREELDNDLGARADQNLTLALLLGVVDSVEAVIEDGRTSHLGDIEESLKKIEECRFVESGGDFSRADCGSAALEVSSSQGERQ